MVTIRSANEIIQNLRDWFKLAQPDLDTKPGTVARDLFIDAPASQLGILYDELSGISNKQSLRLVVGSDLDKLAKNFGLVRKQSTPSTGVPLLTFSSINTPININRGDKVIAGNGFSYSIMAGVAVVPAAANLYKSTASKFREQLDFVGISDEFAVEATVIATVAGSAGNIGAFSLSKTNIPGVSNVTNINPFTGGTDQESDVAFRNRILSSFSGSSVGTTLGYLNVALSVTGVADAVVIEPGDPLMVRDGTIVKLNTDGSKTIVSEGSGGKVDVVVLGSNLVENKDSFIYRDKSNNNDPANSKNNIVLGQISGDENKTINRKRIDNIKNGVLPSQPTNEILEVTGSLSGSNFISKSIDEFGRVRGNYELVKDAGIYGGSPWGFDTFKWISNKISLFNEDRVKGQFNGQDAVTFTDILSIPQVQQNISITNENSTVTSNRSIIQLLHTPATNVTRVFNINTGERYIVTNQNFDRTGTFNTTGRIQISGNTLPTPSDQLQVDYSWIVNYDPYSDFDGLINTTNIRPVTDSIDWGYSSTIKEEKIKFIQDVSGGFFLGTSMHPISTVIYANIFTEVLGTVIKVESGTFVNRLAVTISNLPIATSTIDSITIKNSSTELYNTSQNNGLFTTAPILINAAIVYNTTIILPTDTVARENDKVTVVLNSSDVFHGANTNGSSNGTQITIPSSLLNILSTEVNLLVSYISSISDLLSTSVSTLPVSRTSNGFITSNNGFTNFSPINISKREHQIVQKNLSNQFYIDLSVPSLDFTLTTAQVITVVRLSDGVELWNETVVGSIIVNNAGNYQLILNGANAPALNDRVLVIYYVTDLRKFQPFSYSNTLIKTRLDTLSLDANNKFYVDLNKFINETNVVFSVIEPNTNTILFSVTDGQLTAHITEKNKALLTSSTVDFSTLVDLTNKNIIISGINGGTYNILSYELSSNTLTISNVLDNLTKDQISIIRILDGQEVWNYTGTIDQVNNRLIFSNSAAQVNDKVYIMFFNFKSLRKSPTKLISTIVDQVTNTGVLTVSGTTLFKAEGIIFTATNSGLRLNLSEALRKSLNISSTTQIPNTIKLARISKLEKVITVGTNNDEVLQVINEYDLKNTALQNNLLYEEFISNSSLQNLEFILPSTSTNTSNSSDAKYLPTLGNKLRVTFYYTVENDFENLSYTRNGTLYTNKKFAFINKVYVSSGFKTSQSTRLTFTSFTQPNLGSRYKIYYDYLAPKTNERIIIRYNYNKLISDVTFSLENTRPINADILARQAKQVLLDLTMNVVIADDFKSSSTTVLQNLRDKLVSTINSNELNQIIDTTTLINAAQSVSGIARARILYFNKVGLQGQVLSVQAQKDEYLVANNIILNTETR